ncbi:MAG: TIM barrel protein [Eubacterium sp.]|jgi:deoxyribonuclease-4|nr:TIM barrel protein [Eubacterium sp.]
MGISFGPGGNSISFGNKKFPEDLPEYLECFGLNGYEFECGRGVRISEKTYNLVPDLAKKHNICLSLHAPYYISLSSDNEETRLKSVNYIIESAKAAKRLGAKKIVVHSGSCSKTTRERALGLAKDTLKASVAALRERELKDIVICPETMGKINQLGTLEEVIELCLVDASFLPCVDFGHLNARSGGGIRSDSDYESVFDKIENALGFERLKNMHIHFSKIMYTVGGEKMHLTFEDTVYGPEFEPLIELIAKRGLTPSIVCESQGTQAEDAGVMKKYYERTLRLGE